MSADNSAEQSVLGAMMLSKTAITEVAAILAGPDFYRPDHELVFGAICDLNERNAPADAVTVAELLAKSGDLDRCGGAPYLHALINSVPSPGMAAHYAHIVRRHAQLRTVAALATRLHQMATNPGTDLDDIPDLLLTAIRDIENTLAATGIETTAPRVGELLDGVLDGIEHPEYTAVIHTGLSDLDNIYPGHAPGQLIIIGARPGVGKSVLGLDFARHAANGGTPTLLVSMEMTRTEIVQRLIAAEAAVPLHHITKGECSDYDWDRIAAASRRVQDYPLHIDDTAAMGLPQIRQALTRLQRGGGVGLLVVDYLQLMTAPRAENRQQQVAELSRGLKLLAKEFGIPAIALAQLNRDSEKRADKTPMASDLRESGALEADADSILLLHRPEIYDKDDRPSECDVIVEKCRAGQRGTVTVCFQGHYARCVSYARAWSPHDAMKHAA